MFNLKSSTLRIAQSSLALAFALPICISQAALAQDASVDNDDVMAVISLDGAPDAAPSVGADDGPMTFSVAALPAGMAPPPLDVARMGGGHGMRGCSMGRILEGDNALTDDQYERMHVLRNAMLDKMGPRMAELSSLQRQMHDALGSANIDSKKVNELRNRISAAKTDLSNIKLDHMIAIADVFTPAQRVELHKAMIKSPTGMMGGHHGSWGKGGHSWGHSMGGPGGKSDK